MRISERSQAFPSLSKETSMPNQDVSLALRRAIAGRRASELRQLLDERGLVTFANRLAHWSPRVIADAVTLLPVERQAAVLRHLPSRLRDQLGHLDLLSVRRKETFTSCTPRAW